MLGLTIGFALLLCGFFELYRAFAWKYVDRAYSQIETYRTWRKNEGQGADFEEMLEHAKNVKCGSFLLQNNFEFLTMFAAALIAFVLTIPYLLPIWVLSFLPRRLKMNPYWRFFDNIACASLFFAAAMVLLVANTTNLMV